MFSINHITKKKKKCTVTCKHTHTHEKKLNVGVNIPVAVNRVPENVNTYVEREEREERRGVNHTGNYMKNKRSLPG